MVNLGNLFGVVVIVCFGLGLGLLTVRFSFCVFDALENLWCKFIVRLEGRSRWARARNRALLREVILRSANTRKDFVISDSSIENLANDISGFIWDCERKNS